MKRFRFSLQSLLTLRQREESRALDRYGAALRAHRQARDAADGAGRDLAAAWAGMRQRMEGCCSGAQVALERAQCAALETRVERAREQVQRTEADMNSAHAGLIEARRKREVLDKLHEKSRNEHDREVARQENQFLDELALRRRGGDLLASRGGIS